MRISLGTHSRASHRRVAAIRNVRGRHQDDPFQRVQRVHVGVLRQGGRETDGGRGGPEAPIATMTGRMTRRSGPLSRASRGTERGPQRGNTMIP